MTRFDCASADPAEALHAFTALRQLEPAGLAMCHRPTTCSASVSTPSAAPRRSTLLRRLAAGHDLRHRRQIERTAHGRALSVRVCAGRHATARRAPAR